MKSETDSNLELTPNNTEIISYKDAFCLFYLSQISNRPFFPKRPEFLKRIQEIIGGEYKIEKLAKDFFSFTDNLDVRWLLFDKKKSEPKTSTYEVVIKLSLKQSNIEINLFQSIIFTT